MADKTDFGLASYVLGIISIVMGILTPFAGLIFGIIGINISKKDKGELSKRGLKLNKIGVIVSAIMIILTIVAGYLISEYFPQIIGGQFALPTG